MVVLTKEEKKEVVETIKKQEVLEKESIISWDGTGTFSLKIPKEMIEYFGINEKNRFEKSVLFRIEENPDGTIKKTFDIIKRVKKRREYDKKTTNKK